MGKYNDLTGKRFDRLTVIGREPSDKGVRWRCVCDCGNEIVTNTNVLVSGEKRSCGCLIKEWRESKHKDIIGNRYGMLTVLEYDKSIDRRLMFKCKCDCGKVISVRKDSLENGHSQSCGCVRESWMHSGKLNRKHGKYEERIYWVWAKIKRRCYNKRCREYENYGGRGIKMCEEWLDPEKFIQWAYASGYNKDAPKGVCTLDRIDVNGNYEPSNCRWITNLEQQNNRRDNQIFTHNGESHTIAEWARILGIKYSTLNAGLMRYGKPLEYYMYEYVPRK